jgi:hypothetical protein
MDRVASGWASGSPRLGRAELVLVVVGGLLLAIITSWPLTIHLSSRIAPDLGDPLRTAWQVAWTGHALLHNPLHIFNTNAFWPHTNTLAFSDSLLGYAPAGLIGRGVTATLVRYNLLFLIAWTLPFVGAYLLGRELGLRPLAALVAGAAFAYAPYRAAAAGHLHVISSGGIPLCLFLLLRGHRRESARMVAAGWLVAAWQLSLGFTLGLQLGYLLAILALVAVAWWWRRGRPAVPQRVLAATLIGGLLFTAVGAVESRPYLKVAHDYPSATRKISEVERYSAGPRAFFSAPIQNRFWGSATASLRNGLRSRNESVLFPGLAIALLALIGLTTSVYSLRLRVALAGGAVICAVLALGLGLTGAGYPYRILYDHFPGWDGVRVPGRLFTLATLGLALLAGAGAHGLIGAVARQRRLSRWPQGASIAVVALLGLAVVLEGAGLQNHPHVPMPPAGLAKLPGPQLNLPTDSSTDRVFQFWSSDGFPQIANGVSTFDLPALTDLRGGMKNFPDRPGIEKLRRLGIRTVILHTELASVPLPVLHFSAPDPPDPQQAAVRPIAGLGVTRRRSGPLVIFTIGRAPARARTR